MEQMMATKRLPDIRTSYTPIERALLSAYLGYPDPAPQEIEGIDISQPVDADEWDESVQRIAPLPSLHDGNSLMLENAVARICLEPVARQLPQWASISDGRVTLARRRRPRTALRSDRPRRPKYLFTINWGDSGPGFSWPEKYFVARLPGYEVCIVTASADSPDTHGYCDFAIGWYPGGVSDIEKAGECIREWWSKQCGWGQERWAYLFGTGAVDEQTAERWPTKCGHPKATTIMTRRTEMEPIVRDRVATAAVQGSDELPQFDGFPYLVTRIVPALYHIVLLPGDATHTSLVSIADRQLRANRLDTCLALDARHAIFFYADGWVQPSHTVPRGGTVVVNRLALGVDLLERRSCGGDSRGWMRS
jgi:hypothetical protein